MLASFPRRSVSLGATILLVFFEQRAPDLQLADRALPVRHARQDAEDEKPLQAPRHRRVCSRPARVPPRRDFVFQPLDEPQVLVPRQPLLAHVRHRRGSGRAPTRILVQPPQLRDERHARVRPVDVARLVLPRVAVQELGGGDERAERDELVRGAAMARLREPLQVLERARRRAFGGGGKREAHRTNALRAFGELLRERKEHPSEQTAHVVLVLARGDLIDRRLVRPQSTRREEPAELHELGAQFVAELRVAKAVGATV